MYTRAQAHAHRRTHARVRTHIRARPAHTRARAQAMMSRITGGVADLFLDAVMAIPALSPAGLAQVPGAPRPALDAALVHAMAG